VTDSPAQHPLPEPKAAAKPAPKAAAKPARKPLAKRASSAARPSKVLAVAVAKSPATAAHHPNLGLAPFDMTSGYPAAAATVRRDAARVSAGALTAAAKTDPTLRSRYDAAGLRLLARDAELLVERLAMCLGGGGVRWLTDYAEWIGPIERRRGVVLGDLAAICAGMVEALEPSLGADELAAARRALDAAANVFRRNGRVAGDRHKRNAFLKWMYKGV
jgi:hypothetical protein